MARPNLILLQDLILHTVYTALTEGASVNEGNTVVNLDWLGANKLF